MLAAGGLGSPVPFTLSPPPPHSIGGTKRQELVEFSLRPVVRLRLVKVLGEEEVEAGSRVKAPESVLGQVSSEKSSCT